ncbi:MAG: indole-3-glycerol phosphate synthase TrpC [Acidimicrobiia bacterium]|nr:indole-3-glycerol phosphate synthase TrpC [Acidimicrobiia bacterium]
MLDAIVQSARDRAAALAPQSNELVARARDAAPARPFASALTGPSLRVIAEIKRRSPSAGPIAPDVEPATQALQYVAGGAAAISVLTEPDFFDGSLADLRAVRSTVEVPVLRKDFTVHPDQVWEARAAGADAVLVILAILIDDEVTALLETAHSAGVAALVEAHTIAEVERALVHGAEIVGVNNRDLTTFVTDLATAEQAAGYLSDVAVTVAESGVSSPAGAARMAAAGYDAILVGEAAVSADDPAAFVASLQVAGE